MTTMAFNMSEAAKNAGISRARLYQIIKDGKGPRTTKIGRRTIVLSEDLQQWLRDVREHSIPAATVQKEAA